MPNDCNKLETLISKNYQVIQNIKYIRCSQTFPTKASDKCYKMFICHILSDK